MISTDLGVVTAYGYAKDHGWQGTEQEFGEYLANVATNAQTASAAAATAVSAANNVSNAVSTALSDNAFNVVDWSNGSISDVTGENVSSSERIKTNGFIQKTVKKVWSSNSNGRFALYAYNANGYVGAWNSTSEAFTNIATFQASFDMTAIYLNPLYYEYKFRLVHRIAGGSVQIETVDGVKLDTYVSDLPELVDESSVNTELTSRLVDQSKIANVSMASNINASLIWENGSINTATGANVYSSERARTRSYLPTNAKTIDFGENSTTRGVWILAYDMDDVYVGAYKKSTGTFVTDGSESGFNSERKPVDIGFIQNAYPAYRFRLCVYLRGGDPITIEECATWVLGNALNEEIGRSTTVKVIQYNIGKFNMGVGDLETNVPEKIANYKEFFAGVNADYVFLQEYTPYIDKAHQYGSDATLFDPVFFDKSYYEKETAIKSQRTFKDTYFSYIHTSGDNASWCIIGESEIEGKDVAVVSSVLNVSAPTGVNHLEQSIRALTKLTDELLAGYDYAIVGMDTNCLDQTEANAVLAFMQSKGYKSANWDYFGNKNTYNLSSQMYKAIDNVFVKGNAKIVSFTVPDVYNDLSSDHFPVVAEIRI